MDADLKGFTLTFSLAEICGMYLPTQLGKLRGDDPKLDRLQTIQIWIVWRRSNFGSSPRSLPNCTGFTMIFLLELVMLLLTFNL